MSEAGDRFAAVAVRVRDVTGALERVVGLLRRRAVPVRRLSLASTADGHQELIVRIEPGRSSPERVRKELETLVDVVGARCLDGGGGTGTREMALARLGPGAPVPDGVGRPVLGPGGGSRRGVVEITGTPDEVERALARLREEGTLEAVVRTGEVGVPDDPAGEGPRTG